MGNSRLKIQGRLEVELLRESMSYIKINYYLDYYKSQFKMDNWYRDYLDRYTDRLLEENSG